MIKVYKHLDAIVTVVITTKYKEVTVASNSGSQLYSAPRDENAYGSMGAYIDSWLRAVDGLEPVAVMD